MHKAIFIAFDIQSYACVLNYYTVQKLPNSARENCRCRANGLDIMERKVKLGKYNELHVTNELGRQRVNFSPLSKTASCLAESISFNHYKFAY